MRNKFINKELVFYKLYTSFKEDRTKYVPVWQFIGEVHIKELGRWGLMSYTAVHRAFEMYRKNPNLIERRKTRGKSGSSYYEYRLNAAYGAAAIKDQKIQDFYQRIKRHTNENSNVPRMHVVSPGTTSRGLETPIGETTLAPQAERPLRTENTV